MSLRARRLADQIHEVIGQCFGGGAMSDPRLSGVTITHVKLTTDLQLASVYFRVFIAEQAEQALVGLQHSKGFLRRQLAENLSLRRVPELRFFFDESIEHGARIEALIAAVQGGDETAALFRANLELEAVTVSSPSPEAIVEVEDSVEVSQIDPNSASQN